MGNKLQPGSPASKPPGETHRRRRGKIAGMTGSHQDNHASNGKANKKRRAGERAMQRQRR